MLVTVEELSMTSLYPEIIKAITRDNAQAAEMQILAAESLTRSYMSKYDCDAIFGTADKKPTYKGASLELIKKVIKIIIVSYVSFVEKRFFACEFFDRGEDRFFVGV